MLAQGATSGDTTVYDIAAVVVFLVIVFALAFVLATVHKIRHQRAWRPLVPLVGGRVETGTSPDTSTLRGTYRGHPVTATALPGSALGPGADETVRYNRLVIRLFGISGAGDWRVTVGRRGWQVEADDPTLAARLDAAGVIGIASGLALPHDKPLPGISFSARDRHLELNADAGHGVVPPPDRFEALLTAGLSLAAINSSANPA